MDEHVIEAAERAVDIATRAAVARVQAEVSALAAHAAQQRVDLRRHLND